MRAVGGASNKLLASKVATCQCVTVNKYDVIGVAGQLFNVIVS